MKGATQPTRNRKVSCPECGYTVRMARSWMAVGLPTCPCGEQKRPDSPADLAFAGLIDESDVPGPIWTAICKENGWDDAIVRRGAAAKLTSVSSAPAAVLSVDPAARAIVSTQGVAAG
jgi:hypothetical protein